MIHGHFGLAVARGACNHLVSLDIGQSTLTACFDFSWSDLEAVHFPQVTEQDRRTRSKRPLAKQPVQGEKAASQEGSRRKRRKATACEPPKKGREPREPGSVSGSRVGVNKPALSSASTAAKGSPPTGNKADITAWGHFGLSAGLLDTLSALGFSTPTPIQMDCLPYALRDKRDIIGAAQTVSPVCA